MVCETSVFAPSALPAFAQSGDVCLPISRASLESVTDNYNTFVFHIRLIEFIIEHLRAICRIFLCFLVIFNVGRSHRRLERASVLTHTPCMQMYANQTRTHISMVAIYSRTKIRTKMSADKKTD